MIFKNYFRIIIFTYLTFSFNCDKFSKDQKYLESNNLDSIIALQETYISKRLPLKFINLIDNVDLSNPKLVFRFDEVTCGTCVTTDIRILRQYANSIGWNNILFLTTNNDQFYLDRFIRIRKIKSDIYRVERIYFELDKQLLDTPYMFIFDTDSTFKDLFISSKDGGVRTKQYFESIVQSHFYK